MALKLPTPPTPPTIDKGEATESTPRIDAHQFFDVPFKRPAEVVEPPEKSVEPKKKSVELPEKKSVTPPPQAVERKVTTPEDMARDAVANGSGALTKKTITRPNDESNLPATSNLQIKDNKRGKEILREFQNEDKEISQAVETPRAVRINQNESYSGFYWIGMLIFAGILSIVFVKKFLVRKNPKLKKSDLFEDADKRLQAVSKQVAEPPAEKVAIKKSPPKNDDDKGKHFEVRV